MRDTRAHNNRREQRKQKLRERKPEASPSTREPAPDIKQAVNPWKQPEGSMFSAQQAYRKSPLKASSIWKGR